MAVQESGRFPTPTRVLERAPSSGQWCGSHSPWRPGSLHTCSCYRFKAVRSPLDRVTSSAAHAGAPPRGAEPPEGAGAALLGKVHPRVPSSCPPGLWEAPLPPPPRTPAGGRGQPGHSPFLADLPGRKPLLPQRPPQAAPPPRHHQLLRGVLQGSGQTPSALSEGGRGGLSPSTAPAPRGSPWTRVGLGTPPPVPPALGWGAGRIPGA